MASKLTPEQIATFNDSKEGAVNAGLVVILILTNLSVLSRFAGQLRTQRRLFAEDYLLAVAVVSLARRDRNSGMLIVQQICSNVVNALLFVGKSTPKGTRSRTPTAAQRKDCSSMCWASN